MQKESLSLQEQKCKEFCISKGMQIDKVISEFGSGLNYKRPGLNEIIELIMQNRLENLIIFYKDRLVRFGFDMFIELSKRHQFNIIVIDDSNTDKSKEKEFADDLISIIHYFSMRLYGSRSYKKKIRKAEENLKEIKEELD